jgi:hypothetical protein
MALIWLAVLIFVAWIVAFVFFRVVGAAIHILLIVALVVLVMALAARHGHGRFWRHASGGPRSGGASAALVIPV